MMVQISSGQGPAECELAVYKLYKSLKKEYPDISMTSSHKSCQKDCYTSIQFSTESDLSHLEGTIQWICQSPFRPSHKRKNWFVDVSILSDEHTEKSAANNSQNKFALNDSELRWEYFHCGGKGGQNVNKVETGVRLTHLPTGIVITSTSERNQMLNRKDALFKLEQALHSQTLAEHNQRSYHAWCKHSRIVRGNPVRIYRGMSFLRQNK